jgi:hypothetical protein
VTRESILVIAGHKLYVPVLLNSIDTFLTKNNIALELQRLEFGDGGTVTKVALAVKGR